MIHDIETAKEIVKILDDCSNRINGSIRLIQQKGSTEEFVSYRNAAGFVMGYIYTDVIMPIYKEHPELEPLELKKPPADND